MNYVAAAVAQLRTAGHGLPARTRPVFPSLKHCTLPSRYSFIASVPAAGVLRPLRAPAATELDEDDKGEV
ncbi:hypothetical protein ACFYVL_09515 [Streptomyces sp. NPDC004111]|uniref:hypothetical protein n=1 Tax=Streptomyces sp. NPDC004111 TaxID=3364690 RepID=UPI0036BEADE8